MTVAYTLGVFSLDEASIRTIGRCRAKTFMPNKPLKYGIRFYALNDWKSLYLQSFFDNGAGNEMGLTCEERFLQVFPAFRGAFTTFQQHICKDKTVVGMEKEKQSWFWAGLLGCVSLFCRSPDRKRLVVTDNFYTRPGLAKAAKQLTQGEIRIIGTCRANYVGAPNRANVENGIRMMKAKPRGSWMLVADFEQNPDYKKLEKQHQEQQKKKKKNEKN